MRGSSEPEWGRRRWAISHRPPAPRRTAMPTDRPQTVPIHRARHRSVPTGSPASLRLCALVLGAAESPPTASGHPASDLAIGGNPTPLHSHASSGRCSGATPTGTGSTLPGVRLSVPGRRGLPVPQVSKAGRDGLFRIASPRPPLRPPLGAPRKGAGTWPGGADSPPPPRTSRLHRRLETPPRRPGRWRLRKPGK